MARVLFVCTGNTCRSPIAEIILKSKQLPHIEVKSAGTLAIDGHDMSPNAAIVLEENNLTHQHKSTMLSHEQVEWATHILTMTAGHKSSVIGQYPQAKNKTYTIKEFLGEGGDIIDPFGGATEVYRETYTELEHLISKLIKKLN